MPITFTVGSPRLPQKVKLVAGMISRDTALFDRVRKGMERLFRNKADFESGVFDFTQTGYYNNEMGDGLKRKFLSFAGTVALKDLYKVKLLTNALERKFSRGGNRTVNIDPGYVDLAKLVLFSTKDYSHRLYLGGGIYAEVTLSYKDKTFQPWPWTYPDYATAGYIGTFNAIREIYKKQVCR
ncbi:MAG: DUF4416 family protein [Candidatus Omnitrophota bacterium]